MSTTAVNVWAMIMHPHFGDMTPEIARTILSLSIPESERARMKQLLVKSKSSKLTREESLDLDEYERAGNMLSVLKAKARRILKSKNQK
jgi:hypothetical protein